MHQPDRQPGSRGLRGTPESRPPWNPAVADAFFTAWSGIRELEAAMRRQVSGTVIRRGGSAGNTDAALDAIAQMETSVPECTARDALRRVSRWTVSIQQLRAVGEATRWVRLRPGPDGLPPQCPHCECFSLRLAEGTGVVSCFTPGCHDLDGRQPTGRLDVSLLNATPVLAWRDGITQ